MKPSTISTSSGFSDTSRTLFFFRCCVSYGVDKDGYGWEGCSRTCSTADIAAGDGSDSVVCGRADVLVISAEWSEVGWVGVSDRASRELTALA